MSILKQIFLRQLPIIISGITILVLTGLLLDDKGYDSATNLFVLAAMLMIIFMSGFLMTRMQNPSRKPYEKIESDTDTTMRMIRKVFRHFPVEVEIYDKQGSLTWVNQYGFHFWQLQKGKGVRRYNILKDTCLENSEFVGHLQRALKGEVSTLNGSDYHQRIIPTNHSYKYYETTFVPILSPEDHVCAVMVINRCIIDGNAELIQKNESPKTNGSNPIEMFLRNVSHELRTPLNWILGFSNLLSNEQNLLKIKEYNYHVMKGGNLMLDAIEMLIDMSRIVKNEVLVTNTEFSLNKLLQSITDRLNEDMKRMDNNLTIKLNTFMDGDQTDYLILSDKGKLQRILNCLIHNALKYTKKGFIEIGCVNLPENTLLFYVKDTGIGMSKDIQDYIFDAFSKGRSEIDGGLTGQGLGLSIAKNYVKLLGGNIWFETEVKKGTTLLFTIKDYSVGKISEPVPEWEEGEFYSLLR